MMRTEPDPTFASAARAELQRRVRAAPAVSTPAPRRRSPWLPLSAVGGAVAVLLVAAVAVGLQHLGPAHPATSFPAATASATPAPVPMPSTPAPFTATPSPTASPVATGQLLGITGALPRTDAELRAFARGHAAASVDPVVMGDQDVIVVHCMAAAGWRWDPIQQFTADLNAHPGLSDPQWADLEAALHGPPTSGAYDWRTAGCTGLAVHRTGQDGKD